MTSLNATLNERNPLSLVVKARKLKGGMREPMQCGLSGMRAIPWWGLVRCR
jgi:hypothetical protein